MNSWKEMLRRVWYLGRRSRFDSELEDEARFHIETRAKELEQAGQSSRDALLQARREFGSSARMHEDTRAAWQFQWIEHLFADLRHAFRTFQRRPAFALTAIACLTLGIGANTLIFSLVNAVLLRSLPYPDADRLVTVWFTPPNRPSQKAGTNALGYFTVRDNSHVFESVGAARLDAAFNVSEDSPNGGAPERVPVQWFTIDLSHVLGVDAILGRWPTQSDQNQLVISYGLWQRIFGGAPDVIGKKLRTDFGPMPVIGVLPARFELLRPDVGFWIFQTDPDLRTQGALRSLNRIFTVVARLKPGVTIEQARAEMTRVAPRLAEEMPESHKGWGLQVETLHDVAVGQIRKPLLIFQGAVFFVLLIACANVAGLLLAHASARKRELAMRAALGSSRWRIARQLLTESVLLSLMGGAAGLALAAVGLRVFTSLRLAGFPHEIALDTTVVGFTLLLSLGTGLIFGALPALQISRPDLMEVLRESTRSATASGAHQRLRGAFVVVQVSLALVLLMGAGLTINSLMRLNTVQAGLDPRGLIAFQVPFSRAFYSNAGTTPTGGFQVNVSPRVNLLTERIRARAATLPGVESATLAVTPPLGGEPPRMRFSRQGEPLSTAEQEAWSAEYYPVGAEYFRTLKVPLLRGRELGAQDSETGAPVAVINATMARTFWPNEDPIGKRLQLDVLYDSPREIVGVVGDVHQVRYQRVPQPQLYLPRVQLPLKMGMNVSLEIMFANTFVIRTRGDAAALAPALRAAVAEVDPNQVISSVRTVEEYAAGQLQDLRQYATLFSIFGCISVALAAVGLFGIMAHLVNQRTNEIGIRRALGAPNRAVLVEVLRRGVVLVMIGLGLGMAVSFALTRLIQNLLWGVTATDPLTFALALLAMLAVALLACCVPARRALKVDPVIALRAE